MNILQADATLPVHSEKPTLICHICNDQGGWGRGFVLALSQRYPQAEQAYRAWFRGRLADSPPFELGEV